MEEHSFGTSSTSNIACMEWQGCVLEGLLSLGRGVVLSLWAMEKEPGRSVFPQVYPWWTAQIGVPDGLFGGASLFITRDSGGLGGDGFVSLCHALCQTTLTSKIKAV